MRFAYINSQGKEVAIPSVEALQLRIELGAISSTTMFYDGSADKWAPAEDHDIFRTLQRELTDKQESVYVAPPPPQLDPPPAREADKASEGAGPLPEWPEPPSAERGPGVERQAASAEVKAPAPTQPSSSSVTNPFDGMEFELTPMDSFEAAEPMIPPRPPPPSASGSGFAFGELTPIEPSEPEPLDRVPPASPGLDLEKRPGDVDFSAAPPGWAAEMQFEEPISPHTPDAIPSWMQQLGGGQGGSSAGTPRYRERDTDADLEFGASARTEAPSKPEPPLAPLTPVRLRPAERPKPRRSVPGGVIAALFGVGVVATGGWFGLSALRARAAVEEAPPTRAYEPVAIPTLAPELEPTFRTLAPLALQDAVRGLSDLQKQASLAARPNADWLSGRYLAGASGFADVAAYWDGLGALLTEMRSSEEALFRGALGARMDSMSVPAEARPAIEERAVAGFRSALPERDVVYDQLAEVVRAASGLHGFLLANEDNIDYEPAAAGISRDPVLEAVPLTKQLGDEMWRRVDNITAALEAMSALGDQDGVTTLGLFGITLGRLAETPVP